MTEENLIYLVYILFGFLKFSGWVLNQMTAQKQKGQAANAANTQKAIDLLKVYLQL